MTAARRPPARPTHPAGPWPTVLCVLAALLALGGCTSIPAQGPVVDGRKVADGVRPPRPEYLVRGPGDSDGPEAIVKGFLRAAVDFSSNYAVARSFLTAQSRANWRPDSPVVIYRTDPGVVLPGVPGRPTTSAGAPPGTAAPTVLPASPAATASGSGAPDPQGGVLQVEVPVPVIARIGDDGVYQVSPGQDEELRTFRLVVEDGRWRISQPARGILISERDFSSSFGEVPLYFPDIEGRWLVPDPRWFPYTASPTTVVQALLDGPSSWLAGAVTTGAPPGTRLTANGVRTDGSVTRIDLDRQARIATPAQRLMLYTQLKETLSTADLPFGTQDLAITVNQVAFAVPEQTGAAPQVADEATIDPRPVALDDANRLVQLQLSAGQPIEGVGGLTVAGASHPAVSPATGTGTGGPGSLVYAVLAPGPDRLTRLLTQRPGSPMSVAFSGAELTPPSFDNRQWVWTTPAASGGVVFAARGEGLLRIPAPWLAGYRVISMRVSREGARMLVTATHGNSSYAFVFGIVRRADGTPTALTGVPLQVIQDLHSVQDAAWVDGHTVVVLGTRPGWPDQQVWEVDLGGAVTPLLAANGAQSVTVGLGVYDLWVQSDKSAEHEVAGSLLAVPGYRWPAVPG